jgi:hypothetical protein
MARTFRMAWMPVTAGRDHLGPFLKMNTLAELIWNGLDAEAYKIDVEVETITIGADELRLYRPRSENLLTSPTSPRILATLDEPMPQSERSPVPVASRSSVSCLSAAVILRSSAATSVINSAAS